MTDDEFNDLLDQAQGMTNAQLSIQIAALTTLTSAEIQAMAPTAENMAQLLQFIQIVRSAANADDKKAILLRNIDTYANFIFAIAGKIVGGATSGGASIL